MQKITWDMINGFVNKDESELSDKEKIRCCTMLRLKDWGEKIDNCKCDEKQKPLLAYADILELQGEILDVRKKINNVLLGKLHEGGELLINADCGRGTEVSFTKHNLWNLVFFLKVTLHLMNEKARSLSPEKSKAKKEKKAVASKKPARPRKAKAPKAEATEVPATDN